MKKFKIIKQGMLHTEKVDNSIIEIYIYADRWDVARFENDIIHVTEENLALVRMINPTYVIGDCVCLPWKGIEFYIGEELVDTIYIDHDPKFEAWEIVNNGEDKLIYAFYIVAPWTRTK